MEGRRSVCRKKLHEAVMDGRLDDVKWLLPTRSYIDLPNSSGRTALAEACARGNAAVAHVLLKGGANVNRPDSAGMTPLSVACKLGSISLVDVLLQYRAEVNGRSVKPDGVKPLVLACKAGFVAIVKALTEHGAEVNIRSGQDCGSETLLHAAISRGHVDVVEILLRHGARVDVVDGYGWTPLHSACAKGYSKTVGALIDHGSNVNARVRFVKGRTPLHLAALNGHATLVDILLQRGASINETDGNGQTSLHLAIGNENNSKSACQVYCNSVFELLLSRGALFDERDSRGDTPLRAACWDHNTPVVRNLLRLGAKPIRVVVGVGSCLIQDYWSTVILCKLNAATLSLVLDFCISIGFCTEEHKVVNLWSIPCSSIYGIPRICLYSTINFCDDLLTPAFQRHFIKAYAAGVFSPNFAGASASFVQAWENMLSQPFYAECQRELEIMKILLIPGTTATYHNVLLQNRSRKWNFTSLNEFSAEDCVARFSIYGEMVYARFLALQKADLVNICQDVFIQTDPPLPLEVTCKILDYLPNMDLLNVMKKRNIK